MSLARKIYEKTKIGEANSLMASSTNHDELESFKAVVADFDKLDAAGLINNLVKHKESQTGHHFVDRVQFRRLK